MAELDTEHVRMLDAGKQRVAYSSSLEPSCFALVASKKTQLLQHGNTFGLSFLATEKGFVMTKNDELEASCSDYTKRRQEAMDHGQKLTLEEIYELPVSKEIQLPSIAYWIALSPDELTLAVAYGDAVALFEIAHIMEAGTPVPFHTFAKVQALEIAWCSNPASDRLAVLTVEKQVFVCTLEGSTNAIDTQTDASSIAWSPSGEQIAVGLVDGTIAIHARDSLQFVRSIARPECCAEQGLETHHVNWAEEELILAGYQKFDEENEETSALACIFDNGECVELDEVVGFFDVEGRRHQYFSLFIPDWRMFFIGCSLSADIELLVSDPEGGEWELWKPLEKYQARLPMNADDEESFPMGFALNLNSTTPVPVDEDAFPPAPIISCSNTEGLLVNFVFVDTTVNEVDFVKSPSPFEVKATRALTVTLNAAVQIKEKVPASPKETISHEYGQNDENEFAESDGESSDEEEERKEEEDKARTTFRTIASDGADYILSEQFPKLFKAMGSTYDEEEHAGTVKSLEKDGKIYEHDFVSWYVNWIFGDGDSDSDEDEDADVSASSGAKPAEMKSKDEIAAAFSKFTVKEGSWKCSVCMVNNDANAMKCSACETPNPAAPKVVVPVPATNATSAGSIGSGGFSFPVSTEDASKPSSFSFGGALVSGSDPAITKPTGFSFDSAATTTGFSFPSTSGTSFNFPSSSKPGTGINFGAAATSTAPAATSGFNFGFSAGGSDADAAVASASASTVDASANETQFSFPKKDEYGQNDENEFAESDGESSDEEKERKEEENTARTTFRTIASDGADYILSEQFPKLFKAMGSTYDEEEHVDTVRSLEKVGKIYEDDFVSWYVNWIFGEEDSESEEENNEPVAFTKTISHEYGQNDENEFAESDGESSDEEEERKEEENTARTTFRTIASDGADYILSEQFPKLFKAMGSTYDEVEHADTVKSLEKDGKIYEDDFVSWYVNWIFGDGDSDSDENADVSASSGAKPAEMKSKDEIAAAFSKFTVKEGSWKCSVCMVNNDANAMKCSACETPNPAAPKVVVPVPATNATSAGSIGSGGFSFPVSTGDASKPSSFSFGGALVSGSDPAITKPTGFSFDSAATTTGFSFPSTSGTSFNFPSSSKPGTGINFGAAATSTAPAAASDGGAYPPDTSLKPKPPSFGGASGSGYPPDMTSKPKPPAFGTASGTSGTSGGYPPDTTSKPKPPAFGTTSGTSGTSGGYPPDTTSKPKPPAFGTTSGTSGTSGGYPPDTTSKPKPPAFGTTSGTSGTSGGYPPDTTSKPKPPAFGTASGTSGTSGGYPPDTTSKPKPPAFGTTSGTSGTSGGYPPDTTSKPKPPAFGTTSGTSGTSGGYPPDTTSKPKPPAFGTASGTSGTSGGYPPDTTSKPKPPAFGTTSGTSGTSDGYPPDTTSKPKPPTFGQSSTSDKRTASSSFGFGSFGKSTFGSKSESSASTEASAQANNAASTVTPTKPKSLFGRGFGNNAATDKASDTSSSPFDVVPKTNLKSAFSFGSNASANDSNGFAAKTSSARPRFSFDSFSSTLDKTERRDSSEDHPQTKRTLNFGDTRAFEAKANAFPDMKAKAKPVAAPTKASKGIPCSRMEGQLWKLIVDFDKSLKRVNQSSKNISSRDAAFSKKILEQMDKLRLQISCLCDEINTLDESRDQIEKDVLFVIGSDGDVHEQLEYGREILHSFNDEALKRTLEGQPLDQRSKESWESLKDKLSEVEKSCGELDSHLSTSKIDGDGTGAMSTAHLFRVLKQTYDNSKMQYNKACKLAEHLEKLSLRGDRMRRTNGVGGISGVEAEAHPIATKAEMTQMIVETEQRSQDVRCNFLSLCNNVVTPRDAFSTPRRKLAPPTPSDSSNSPLRIKACSKLMPKTQLSVASPMSSAKQSLRSVSFKENPVKSGSKLFSLAEAMAPKEEPAKLVQTPQPAQSSVGVGKAPQRPSLGAPATESKPTLTTTTTASKPNVFSFPKSTKETPNSFGALAAKEEDKKTSLTSSSFGGFGVSSPAVKPKPKENAKPNMAFSLGGKEAPASSSAFSFGSKKDLKSAAQPLSAASATTDYKTLLEKFYKVHNPSKVGSVIEKALTTYKDREEDLFTRLFTMYVPDSTPEDVKKYLSGGPVPPKLESGAAASKSPVPANTTVTSPFGSFGASITTPKESAAKSSPFGASPSTFSLGPAANNLSSFGGFGSTAANASTTSSTTTTPSLFGKPTVDYRQKLVEFYQKHNPDKLSSVDATLEKYKGNEEKLFQNLAVKYKVNATSGNVPASPAVQRTKPNATASPFGKPGAFSVPNTSTGSTFGSASSVGFGAANSAPSASPLNAPASSPFGTSAHTSSGFGAASGSGFGGFQSTTATTPAFGAPSPFGTAAGRFGAGGGVNYREKLVAFYQQHNPAKLSSVDATLEKYKGREDHLFAMLEQKYLKKIPTAGGFGIPSTTTFGGGSGFGAPSALGAANAAPAFGSASNLGGTAQPAFGGAAGSNFGMASRMGGGFGSAAPAASSGATSGSGFGAFGSQTPSFGVVAQQPGGFGAAAGSGGFGSGFGGGAATSGFGQPATFSNPSFTQMR